MSTDEDTYNTLWTNLQSDENYPGLADYVMGQNDTLKNNLTEFRDRIADDISEGDVADFNVIITSVCHPPPGCKAVVGRSEYEEAAT